MLVADGTALVTDVSAPPGSMGMARACLEAPLKHRTAAAAHTALTAGAHPTRQAAARHQTAPTSTAALGRALLGTLLMGAFRKEQEATQVGRSVRDDTLTFRMTHSGQDKESLLCKRLPSVHVHHPPSIAIP